MSTPLTDDDLVKITGLARSFESVLVPQRTMLRLLDEVAAHRTLVADVLAIHTNRNGFCDACFEAVESPSDDTWARRESRRLRWPCPTARLATTRSARRHWSPTKPFTTARKLNSLPIGAKVSWSMAWGEFLWTKVEGSWSNCPYLDEHPYDAKTLLDLNEGRLFRVAWMPPSRG